MKKVLFAVFNVVFALLLLSSVVADTGKTFNASPSSESPSDCETSGEDLVIIEPDTKQGTNGKAVSLAIIDDVLVGNNPSPLVPMGIYQIKDPDSLSEVIPAGSNETEILDGIPNDLKPSPLLSMGKYEISEDDLAALWVGMVPESFFVTGYSDDYASVGHLMNLAENAAAELNSRIPGGAGSEINDMVAGFKSGNATNPEERDVTAMVGQVINVARPFYDRLQEMEGVVWPNGMKFMGGNGKYPWSDLSENAGDAEKIKYYAFAKKGQVNSLFAWGFSSVDTEDAGNENANNDLAGANSGNIFLNHNLHGQILIPSSIVDGNSASDAGNLSTLQVEANENEDKYEKSIYEYAGAIRVNILSRICSANDCGGFSCWSSPLPSASRSYRYITLGGDYVVQDCYFLSDLVGQEYAGTSSCYGAIPEKTTFIGIPTPVIYYIRTHNCSGGYEYGDHSGYGKAKATTSLLSSSVGGEVHQFGTPHTRISCGTSFAPWVWGIEKSQAQSKNIQFGRKYQTNDNTQGKRVIKVDHSSRDITVTCKGNFSFETKLVLTYISTPVSRIFGYTTEITITPGSVAGQYEGELTIECSDNYTNYREIYKLSHSGDAARTITYPLSESSGPKYRKVSLTGRPINDDKPQMEKESDFTPPETFVDALSQNLRHNVNDYIQPIPTSNDLVLAVRRNYNSEVWSPKSGLLPAEREDLPFGLGWSSNIVSCVELQYQDNYAESTDPDYAVVTDENGMSFRFAMVPTENGRKFYPLPNDKSDAQAFLNTLTENDDGTLVFKKKYGTTLTFKPSGIPLKVIPYDRLKPVSLNNSVYSYYRLHEVSDRFGNLLRYEYDESATRKLIPSKIWNVLPTGVTDVALNIQQNSSGLVEKIICPMGLELNYEYENGNLKSVRKGGDDMPNMFTYSYVTHSEPNVFQFMYPDSEYNDFSYFHFDLGSITDGVGNEYVFDYKNFTYYCIVPKEHLDIRGGGVYSRQGDNYYVPSGGRGRISKVTIKQNGEVFSEASFSDSSTILLERNGNLSSIGVYEGDSSVSGTRRMTVTDGVGNKVVYSWQYPSGDVDLASSAVAYSLDSFSDIYGGTLDSPFNSPSVVYYRCMTIDYFDSDGAILGTEKVKFDMNAGMAISSHTDMYGNTTTFSYDESLPIDETSRGYYYASKYSDPTSQIDALGNVTEFTYDANTRIMTSVKKKAAGSTSYTRQTVWNVDSLGRRKNEKIVRADGYIVKETDNFYNDTDFKNFITRSTILSGTGPSPLVMDYSVDSYGNISRSSSNSIWTSYGYNAAGSKIWQENAGQRRISFTYDNARKLLIGITNPDNTTKSFSYDAIERKIAETDENGNTTSFEYNALHKVTKNIQPLEVVTQTEYNAVGAPIKITDPNGNVTTFEYDALCRLVKKIQYSGENESGVVTYEYGQNSGSNLFSTDDFNPTKITNTRGYDSSFTYDALYRTSKTEEEYANETDNSSSYEGDGIKTTLYTYDIFGNKTSETDDNGNVTSYEYNAQDKLIKTTFADGTYKSAAYSSAGLLTSETDEMGNTTSYSYNYDGNLVQKKYPSVYDYDSQANINPIERFSYDYVGNLISKIDPLGNETNFTYDSRNRVIKEEKPSVHVGDTETFARPTTITTYDGVGNKTSVTDPNGNITTFEYDALNRLVKTTYPEVNWYRRDPVNFSTSTLTELLKYDANGNVVESTDTYGIKTTMKYDYQNKMVEKFVNYMGPAAIKPDYYSYDTEGNLISITDMEGIVTRYEYDGLNRRTNALYYATADEKYQKTKQYIYDGLNLAKEMPACIDYLYDSRNRLKQRSTTYNGKNSEYRYAYDACSRITSVSAFGLNFVLGDASYTYDALGRILSETSNTKKQEYEYDLAGNERVAKYCLSRITPSHKLEKSYDSNNRVLSISDDSGRVVNYGYDLCGNMVAHEYPNGVKTVCEYDALNRLVSKSASKDGVELMRGEYGYNKMGNASVINQYDGDDWQKVFCYYDDGLHRLTSEEVTYSDGSKIKQRFSYVGYRLTQIMRDIQNADGTNETRYERHTYWPGTGMLGRYDITLWDNSKTVDNMVYYDDLGNVSMISYAGRREHPSTVLILDGDDEKLTYDGFGRLVEYTKTSQLDSQNRPHFTAYYQYDYRNRRVQYAKNTDLIAAPKQSVTNYYYSGGTSVLESNGTTETHFYRGPDMGGGVGGINYACNADGSGLNYKHYNLRGDVIGTTGSAGEVLSHSYYTTYGTHTDFGAMPADNHRANTKVEDSDTNLLLEGHRYRLLGFGVFLSPDPLEYVDGLNMYAYCGYNPWGRFDPTGLSFLGYDSFRDYARDVAEVWKGYGLAVKDTVSGIYHMQTDPVGTAKGLANAVMNPIETGKAVVNNISDTWDGGYEGKGRVVGHILIGAALAMAPSAESANVAKAGTVVDVAGNAGSKSTQVARVGDAAEAAAQAGAKTSIADISLSDFMGTKISGGRKIIDTIPEKALVRNFEGKIFKRVEKGDHGGLSPHTHPYYRNKLPDGSVRDGIKKSAEPPTKRDIIDATRENAQRTGEQ